MNRRNFLKAAAVLTVFPTSLFAVQPAKSELVWTSIDGEWGKSIRVKKGPWDASFDINLHEMEDCHGLCATEELAYLIEEEIVYGLEGLKKIWAVSWFEEENDRKRKKLMKDLKRVKLSNSERLEIRQVLKTLRGPHNCVHD